MAITLDHGLRFRDAMKGLLFGAAFAVGLAALEGDASAGLTAEVPLTVAPAGGTVRARMTLAKAKKKKRGGSSSSKADSDDSAGGDDDATSKPAAASSDSGDDSAKKEEEQLFGPSKKKKAAPPAGDDGDASEGGSSSSSRRPAIKEDKSVSSSDDKPVDTVSAKASEEESGASPVSALEFGLGARALFRNLQWTSDGRAAGLGPYTLTPGPQTGLWLEFYPAAFGTKGFAANVGLYGSFNYGFGVATTLANGKDAATTFSDFQAGVKLRIPVGTFIPNVSVGYGQQIFAIAQTQTTADLPQLSYQFVRPALGTRVMFTPTIALDVTAAYLMVLDPGSGPNQVRSSRFFPKATSYGVEVSASVGFRITETIGARAGADWRQYGLSLNPDSTTRQVAGAVDRYVVAWAGLEVVLGGPGSGSAGGDDEPVKPSKRKRHRAPEAKPDDESGSGDDDTKSKKSDSDEE